MQMFKALEQDDAARVGWGVRVLLASPTGQGGHIARRLSGLGGQVEVEEQLYDALSQLIDDPRGTQMLVVDCDAYGGIEAGRRGFALLADQAQHMPIVLITSHCREQTFPPNRDSPIVLRAPVSAVALRVAFDAAFRGRRVIGTA